jgi:hypothetical protein
MQANSSWIMHRGRPSDPALRSFLQAVRGLDTSGLRPAALDGAVIPVCFLALVALVVLGAMLMLFSWITAGLPSSAYTMCATIESCAAPTPAKDPRSWVDGPQLDEPTETR